MKSQKSVEDNGEIQNVFFVPSNDANFREMAVVASFMTNQQIANPIFLPEKVQSIHTQNQVFKTLVSEYSYESIVYGILGKILYLFFPLNKVKRKKFVLNLKLQRKYHRILRILKHYKPASIVLRGDRHLGNGLEPAFIRAGRELAIPTIVLTYSFTSDPESLLYRRRSRKDLDGSKVDHLEERFPGQYFYDNATNKEILYRPEYQLEVLVKNDMLPRYPWVMGGGNSDFIIVAGESTKERLIRLGCQKDKIVTTGLAVHDDLYCNFCNKESIKSKLYQKYQFKKDKLLVVVSPLQLYEEKLTDLQTAKIKLRELLELCIKIEANVLISLHPRMKRNLYDEVVDSFGVPIADEQLFNIISCCDIFAAPYSSTVEWAVMCRIPTVIFDFYNLNYTIYDTYDGVFIKKDKDDFLLTINDLISDNKRYSEVVNNLEQTAVKLSPFDGNCLKRIAEVIVQS